MVYTIDNPTAGRAFVGHIICIVLTAFALSYHDYENTCSKVNNLNPGVCYWFLPYSEAFSQGSPVFLPSQTPTSPNFN